MGTGVRVSRTNDRAAVDATIVKIVGEDALLDYDEGGQGWWPLKSLTDFEADVSHIGLKVGARVNRTEGRTEVGGVIAEIVGDSALINYDEGGQGWWPLDRLAIV